MAIDSKAFAIDLVQHSHEWAERYVAQEYGRIRSRLRAEGLIEYCRSLMWREYMLGVHVPAKALALLPDDAQDLKLLLTRQILEEWKHSRVFSERVRALGGDADRATRLGDPDMAAVPQHVEQLEGVIDRLDGVGGMLRNAVLHSRNSIAATSGRQAPETLERVSAVRPINSR